LTLYHLLIYYLSIVLQIWENNLFVHCELLISEKKWNAFLIVEAHRLEVLFFIIYLQFKMVLTFFLLYNSAERYLNWVNFVVAMVAFIIATFITFYKTWDIARFSITEAGVLAWGDRPLTSVWALFFFADNGWWILFKISVCTAKGKSLFIIFRSLLSSRSLQFLIYIFI